MALIYAKILDETMRTHWEKTAQQGIVRFNDGKPEFNRLSGNEVYIPEEIERISQLKQENYGLKKVEILDGNIGYLQLNKFVHPHVAGESMRAAMAFLAYTQALIIDFRFNGGGEGLMGQFLCSYFFSAFEAEHIQLNSVGPTGKASVCNLISRLLRPKPWTSLIRGHVLKSTNK